MAHLHQRGFAWIEEQTRLHKRRKPELLVLAGHVDPFNRGSAGDHVRGKWFGNLFTRYFGGKSSVHLRAVYYVFGSIPVTKPDGKPFTYSGASWNWLDVCSLTARALGYVPPDAFVDHGNQPPILARWERGQYTQPQISASESHPLWLPEIHFNWPTWPESIASPVVFGYEADDYQDRAFNLEVWIEKTTMNDVLLPVCTGLGVTLCAASGFQSESNVVRLLQRIREIGKPARIFYVSDFDLSGRSMPLAVARRLEYWQPIIAPDVEVKLTPLALNEEQIKKYKLPHDPEDKKTELDALEALHPGELGKIVRHALLPYLDSTLPKRRREAEQGTDELVKEEWQSLITPYEQKVAQLRRRAARVVERYEKEAVALHKRLHKELRQRGLVDAIDDLQDEITEAISGFEPDLPERPRPAVKPVDESQWLLDTGRDYFAQLKHYKANQHQRGGTAQERRIWARKYGKGRPGSVDLFGKSASE